jgi:HAD superfamily hydrolase (TIGR01549 family)
VLGLVAACLGLDREDEEAHAAVETGYGLAMRRQRLGSLLADYHTAQVPPRQRNRHFATRAEELVAGDWPSTSRGAVARHAAALCLRLDVASYERPAREGARELLQTLAERHVPVGLVSNALSGAGTRGLMGQLGFERYIRVQVYSDEAGIRKPNPRIFALAARRLGVRVEDCWYVGDTYDRDVLGARRAGLGGVVLMASGETTPRAAFVGEPDQVVRRPLDILALLANSGSPARPDEA